MIMMEDYCCECDGVINAECDCEDFNSHKAGRVRCPMCGAVNLPCNECADHTACNNCPYVNAKIITESEVSA